MNIESGGRNVKYLEYNTKGEFDDLKVVLINDTHIGAASSNIKLLKEVIYVAKTEKARVLLNGDYIEGVLKDSKGEIYEQKMTPEEQAEFFVELMMPIKQQIDGITIGNHDFRVVKNTSFDPVKMIAKDLGVKDKYLEERGIIGFSINGFYYSIEMHHGVGGGSTLAAVENAMKKLWKSDSDIMYCGHWHKEFTKPIKRFSIYKRHKKIMEEMKWLICGNTTLDTAKYAVRGGFEESFSSQAIITLSGKNKKAIKVDWIR
jgi:uncharacterized membrane protein